MNTSNKIEIANRDKKEGFDQWIRSPLVSAMISMQPPSENLEVLLKACFEAGYATGVASIMMDIITHMNKPKEFK